MSQRRTELEHAFRQANRAAKQGDLASAERWSKTAERLAAALDKAEAAEAEEERLTQETAEEIACVFFAKVAYVAHAMVHRPSSAPAAFQHLIKLWREQNMGEGEADADRAAAKLAASHAAYLDGSLEQTLPDYVRERLDAAWGKRREELEGQPVVPKDWEEQA